VRRPELEHIIRAAATLAEDDELIVVGSQAVLGQFPDAPKKLLASREADVYPRNRPERGIEIEGGIGEGSYFDATYGYYAHAVGPKTATLPEGWEQRLVEIRNENTGGASDWCLEIHDLLLSKSVAARGRDWDFVEEAVRLGLARPAELRRRLVDLPVSDARRAEIGRVVDGLIARAKSKSSR
jgi:hypothetical protein